jgi:hypothetical protein
MALLALLQAPLVQAQTYQSSVQGTIRDAVTGRPLAGIYVWPFRRAWGAITDSAGRYELRGFYTGGQGTIILRYCADSNLAVIHLDFRTSHALERDTTLTLDDRSCPEEPRAPWAVNESDTTSFRGHYIYSWEGGGWLSSCDQRTYSIDWSSVGGEWHSSPWEPLRAYQRKEGQRAFVRARGRVSKDYLDVFPSGPLFLVERIEELRDARKGDCT